MRHRFSSVNREPGGDHHGTSCAIDQGNMDYVEEREFVVRLELRCPFPPDYDGDDDGYVWFQDFAPIAAEIVQAASAVIRARPGWTVRTANRGRPIEEEVTLVIERIVGAR